jgi:hypothetical protein
MPIVMIRRDGAHGTRINHQNERINENLVYTVNANADSRMSCLECDAPLKRESFDPREPRREGDHGQVLTIEKAARADDSDIRRQCDLGARPEVVAERLEEEIKPRDDCNIVCILAHTQLPYLPVVAPYDRIYPTQVSCSMGL